MKIHIIGIGGIGVSALAQQYLSEGNEVSGSDLVASEITDFLKEKGIAIIIGQKVENVPEDAELVVYSPAVPGTNPELAQARALKLRTITYPEALGELSKKYFTIAVAGAHGKSTTTAMIALCLEKAGIDPTVIVGTRVKEFGNSNFRKGSSKYLVIEACEYDSSFLQYEPNILVLTNIDKEHMDYFKTFENVVKAFQDFIGKVKEGGFLVLNQDDAGIKQLDLIGIEAGVMWYSLEQEEATAVKNILKVPGAHNVSNALAALEVSRILEVKDELALKALGEFMGTWRRFEVKETELAGKKITLVSDYGHHPNEIKATLQAAREKFPDKKIWLLFQPHQYQRTFYLFDDFVDVFQNAPVDQVLITDIYDVAGRETAETHDQVNSEKLVEKIAKENVNYIEFSKAEVYLKENVADGEVLVVMGAGDIYQLAEKL